MARTGKMLEDLSMPHEGKRSRDRGSRGRVLVSQQWHFPENENDDRTHQQPMAPTSPPFQLPYCRTANGDLDVPAPSLPLPCRDRGRPS